MSIKDPQDVKRQQLQRDKRFEPYKNIIQATIISVDGATRPVRRPSLTWISEYGRPESAALVLNDTVLDIEGTPVLVGPDPRPPYRRIIGVYEGGVYDAPDGDIVILNIPNHATNHQMPTEATIGPDPVKVYQPAIQPLKTTADNATLIITTQEYQYTLNGVRRVMTGRTTDMTSYVPVTGARRVLVYLDKEANGLLVLSGTTVPNSPAIPIPYPPVPAGKYRASAWIRMYAGQTSISMVDDVTDAREFFSNDAVSESLVATQVGQILISLDGQTFEPRLPLISEFGWLVNEEGLLVI